MGGFCYSFDTTKLTNGNHTIKFNFNGILKENEIIVKNNAAAVNIESLTENLKGITTIKGYILSEYNPSIFNDMNCNVCIDGECQDDISNLKTGIERKDIKEKYPQYEMAGTGGFSYDLDTTKLTNGKHTIKFNFKGIEIEKEIVIKNNATFVNIESLTDDLKGISLIKGYILSDNNPSTFNFMNCRVYIDGELQNDSIYNLKTGIERKDLEENYPDYEYAETGGFFYKLDTVKLNNGVHILKLDFNGIVQEQKFVVNNYNQTLVLDKFDTTKIQGFMKVTGYAITAYSNLSSLDYSIYIDCNKINNYYFDFKSDLSREELNNEYPYCNNLKNCGFKYIIDTRSLQDGKHKITIKCKNVESTLEFTVDNSNYIRELDTNSDVTFNETFKVMNEQIKTSSDEVISGINKMNSSMEEMNSAINKMNSALDKINTATNDMISALNEMNIAIDKIKNIVAEWNATLDGMNNAVNEMSDGIKKISDTVIPTTNSIIEMMKMTQRLEAFLNNEDAIFRETYIQYTPQNDNIFESCNNKIVNYISTAVEHMVYGNFTDKINVLGVGGDIVLGVFDVDLPGDLRDVSYDVSHWEWSWNNAAEIAMDGIGLLPVVGVIKYGDKIGLLVKDGEKSVKTVKIKDTLEEILQDSEKENNSIIKNGEKVISEGGADIIKNGNLDDLPDNALEMFQKYEKSGWQGTVPGQTPGTAAGS